jgi:hypothetical protein
MVDGSLHPGVPSVELLEDLIRKRSGFSRGVHEGGGGAELLSEARGGIGPGSVPKRFECGLQCFNACRPAGFQKSEFGRNTLQKRSDFRYISFR